MMDNYEKTIDLVHVFNYVKFNLKKIIRVTLVVAIVIAFFVVGKSVIKPGEELYYSTTKMLFKFNSWSTTEKQYNFENWNLVGAENYKSDSNGAFIANSKNIFVSDRILSNVIEEFDIEEGLAEFKEKIIVSRIDGTDVLNFVVTAESAELAEDILGKIIEEGLKSIEGMYELEYEVIDSYTETEKSFESIVVRNNGEIETSSNFMDSIKIVILASGVSFMLAMAYFLFKCVFNNKVESVELIEGGFGVPVLQVLKTGSSDYDITTTKLINSNAKNILFASVRQDDSIGVDIALIAKKMVERNKKVLIVCVERDESVHVLDNYKAENVDLVFVESENLLNKVLEENKAKYDIILIETNCLDDNSDALLISRYTDFTVIVTKCNTIDCDKFNRKIQEFKRYSSGVNGVILKDVDKLSSSYKYINN